MPTYETSYDDYKAGKELITKIIFLNNIELK